MRPFWSGEMHLRGCNMRRVIVTSSPIFRGDHLVLCVFTHRHLGLLRHHVLAALASLKGEDCRVSKQKTLFFPCRSPRRVAHASRFGKVPIHAHEIADAVRLLTPRVRLLLPPQSPL